MLKKSAVGCAMRSKNNKSRGTVCYNEEKILKSCNE